MRLKLNLLRIAIVLFLSIATDRLRHSLTQQIHKIREAHEVYALPPPSYLKAMTIGYNDAVVALLWASTLYQYGDHVLHNRRFSLTTQYLQTITFIEPEFRPAYRYLSTLITMQAESPSQVELEITKQLFQKGIKHLYFDANTWGGYASFLLYDGAQYVDEATKKQWRIEGASIAQRASELGYFIEDINYSGALYLERAGMRELSIRQLERAFAIASNDETRNRILTKLRKLQSAAWAEQIEHERKAIQEQWQSEVPFVDRSLFLLIKPKPDIARCVGKPERCWLTQASRFKPSL